MVHVGNSNTVSNTFKWTYDNIPPKMTISAKSSTGKKITSGSKTTDKKIILTFTSSKVTSTFNASKIAVKNGKISVFSGKGSIYKAIFIPKAKSKCMIVVPASKYTDSTGNKNTVSNTFTWTYK